MMQDQGLIGALESGRAEIRRFLVARTGSEADAEDLLSELWIKVRAEHSGPIVNSKSYIYRMANNLVLDRLRAARRRQRREAQWTAEQHGEPHPSVEVIEPAPSAEEMLIDAEQAKRLAEAIAQLPPGAQRVLRRHKLDGLSHGDIAAELGISRSAVEKHMAVAMTHLRRLMGD
jgi:RNA polymerase sigma-70 factor (ECF subfamily)